MSGFLISIAGNRGANNGTIHDPEQQLKVKAIDLVDSNFKPSKGEVRYFVTAGSKKLAFETQGYKRHKKLHILTMIAQYCVYLGLFEAQIHATLSGIS